MKKYQSSILRTCHEDAEGLFKIGLLTAAEMREFDVDCLMPSAIPIRETAAYGGDSIPSTPIPAVAAARS